MAEDDGQVSALVCDNGSGMVKVRRCGAGDACAGRVATMSIAMCLFLHHSPGVLASIAARPPC
jgi:hypothetical protein